MNKTMKIIDLLNKIANGEEVPKKFKMLSPVFREEMIFTYDTKYKAYLNNNNSPISMNLSDNLQNLNDTIEIIDEEPEIDIQEIEELSIIRDIRPYSKFDNRCLDKNFETIIKQQNKILEAVKQLDNQINNKGGKLDE